MATAYGKKKKKMPGPRPRWTTKETPWDHYPHADHAQKRLDDADQDQDLVQNLADLTQDYK